MLATVLPGTTNKPTSAGVKVNLTDAANSALAGVKSATLYFCKLADPNKCIYLSASTYATGQASAALTAGTVVSAANGVATGTYELRHVYVYDDAGKEAIRREYDATGELAHETLYFTPSAEVRDGQLVRWVFWSRERIAESRGELPSSGDSIPAVTAAFGLLLAALLARLLSRIVATLRRPMFAMRPAFAALAVLLASLTCGGDASDALRPDGTQW